MASQREPRPAGRPRKYRKLSAKAFCLAWNSCDSLTDFCLKYGWEGRERQASGRAWRYRKKGVPLKKFDENVKWAELAVEAKKVDQEHVTDYTVPPRGPVTGGTTEAKA